MTVIAWDGQGSVPGLKKTETLATDSMVSSEHNEHMESSKMYLRTSPYTGNDVMLAGAGPLQGIINLLIWWENGKNNPFPFTNNEMVNAQLIVVDNIEKEIVEYNNNPIFPLSVSYELSCQCAWGKGAQVALAAMMSGSDAIEAVKTAIKISPGCGGAIQYCDTKLQPRKIEFLEPDISYKKVSQKTFDIKMW